MEEVPVELAVRTVNVEVGFLKDRGKERRLREGAFIYLETVIFLSVER